MGVSPASGSPGRAAPVVDQVTLVNSTKVVSSTRHSLLMNLSATHLSTGLTYMSLVLAHGSESHEWDFNLPSTAVNVGSTGSGTVKVATTKLHGYGKLMLAIAARGTKKTTSCSGQPVSATRPVTLTGDLLWNTRSTGAHKWGSVGSATRKFHFSTASNVTWGYQNTALCPAPPLACASSTSWSVFKSSAAGTVGLGGGKAGRRYYIVGSRSVHLAHTGGNGTRYDFAQATAKPFSLTVKSGGGATMKVAAGTGTATIASPSSTAFSTGCGTGSKQLETRSWGGSWKNGTHPMHVAAQVFGSFSVPNESTGATITKHSVV
jgi:hypothetical protein